MKYMLQATGSLHAYVAQIVLAGLPACSAGRTAQQAVFMQHATYTYDVISKKGFV